jgi:hypothetical protein
MKDRGSFAELSDFIINGTRKMSLYNVKENGHGYEITKFDEDLNPEGHYTVALRTCECKAGGRPTCRHREMLPLFQGTGRVNTGWFYEFEDGKWFFLDQELGMIPEKRIKGHWRRA